ncbi:MAG: polysaccharide deacetylase [Jatrophihabitantaceae bacterium]|nr:polysaccharide deacetylase [Jatrophihabitantaceae bacterium]
MDRRSFLRRAGLVAGGAVVGAGGGLAHEWEHIHYGLAKSGHALGEERPPDLTQTRLIYRVPAASGASAAGAPSPGTPRIALTFDDGPSTAYTARVLDVLAAADVRATFFQVGERVRALPALAREVAARHAVGNHTWDHPDLSLAEAGEARSQLQRTHDEVASVLGQPPTLFRPPFGRFSGATAMIATSMDYPIVLWDTLFDVRQSAEANIEQLAASAQDGTIILGHDGGPLHSDVVIEALPELIAQLKDKGFQFQTIPELLASG